MWPHLSSHIWDRCGHTFSSYTWARCGHTFHISPKWPTSGGSNPHLRCKTRQPARAPLNLHLSATGQLQGCSPARSTTPQETEKGCNKFGPRHSRNRYCLEKKQIQITWQSVVLDLLSRIFFGGVSLWCIDGYAKSCKRDWIIVIWWKFWFQFTSPPAKLLPTTSLPSLLPPPPPPPPLSPLPSPTSSCTECTCSPANGLWYSLSPPEMLFWFVMMNVPPNLEWREPRIWLDFFLSTFTVSITSWSTLHTNHMIVTDNHVSGMWESCDLTHFSSLIRSCWLLSFPVLARIVGD